MAHKKCATGRPSNTLKRVVVIIPTEIIIIFGGPVRNLAFRTRREVIVAPKTTRGKRPKTKYRRTIIVQNYWRRGERHARARAVCSAAFTFLEAFYDPHSTPTERLPPIIITRLGGQFLKTFSPTVTGIKRRERGTGRCLFIRRWLPGRVCVWGGNGGNPIGYYERRAG